MAQLLRQFTAVLIKEVIAAGDVIELAREDPCMEGKIDAPGIWLDLWPTDGMYIKIRVAFNSSKIATAIRQMKHGWLTES